MKITKQRLKQIIKEELTSTLTEMTTTDEAASLGVLLLRGITRQRGKRRDMADVVREIFKVLGGDEALRALEALIADRLDLGGEPEKRPTPDESPLPDEKPPGFYADNPGVYEEEKDDNWIQGAEKDIEKRGTEGVCTGDKFGGPTCRPGTKRYNLAKTFRKMAKDKKK
jgi:hypothetical protein